MTVDDFAVEGTVFQIGVPPRRIDILTSISGLSFDEAWESKFAVEYAGMPAFALGKQALIRNKRATGRTKGLADAEWLERTDARPDPQPDAPEQE